MRSLTDRYLGEDILVHEFAHGVDIMGLRFTDATWLTRLTAAYNAARAAGKYANSYAGSTVDEYWAEGVQDWFNCNIYRSPADGIHIPVADAAYVRLAPEDTPIVATREVEPGIILDLDEAGRLIGIEVLNVRSRVSDGGAALASRTAA